MSTPSHEAITKALHHAGAPGTNDIEVLAATARAYIQLVSAVTAVDALHNLKDATDDVRRRIPDDELRGFEGSTWKHPRVVQYGKAASEICRHIAAATAKQG